MTIQTVLPTTRARCRSRRKTESQQPAVLPRAAFWVCEECEVWWGSREVDDTDARLLLRAAEPALPWFEWHAFRGWQANGITPNTCPECGCKVHKPKLATY